MKRTVLLIAASLLSLVLSFNAFADTKKDKPTKPSNPPIEDVVILLQKGHGDVRCAGVATSQYDSETTEIICSHIGDAVVFVFNEKGRLVDSIALEASDEASILVNNPVDHGRYTVVVASNALYTEVVVD